METETTQETKEIKKFLPTNLQIFLTVAGVVVALLNVWLAYKLAPISENIAVISTKVEAIEKKSESFISEPLWDQRLDSIDSRLDRIENKIDSFKNN